MLLHFDDGPRSTTANDCSPYGNAGAFSGAAFTNDSVRGTALIFDGINDFVSLPNANELLNFDMGDYKVTTRITIPDEAFETERHSFRIEAFATDLDPLPFSIAPMPEGGFLLTEKTKGLSIISPEGYQSALSEGTPTAYGTGHP